MDAGEEALVFMLGIHYLLTMLTQPLLLLESSESLEIVTYCISLWFLFNHSFQMHAIQPLSAFGSTALTKNLALGEPAFAKTLSYCFFLSTLFCFQCSHHA